MTRIPHDPIAFTDALTPFGDQIRTLLLQAASTAASFLITPEEKARFDLSLQMPGPETFATEQQLTSTLNQLTERSIQTATVALLHFCFQVDPTQDAASR